MSRKLHQVIGVLFLATLLMVAVSCDNNGTNTTNDGTTTNRNSDVISIDLTFHGPQGITTISQLSNYIGKTDTVLIRAKAKDNEGVGVDRAEVQFSLEAGPGAIVRQDSMTNTSGDITALYVVSLTSDQTVTIKAEVGGASIQRSFPIRTREVRLTATAPDYEYDVVRGGQATSDITLTVSDTSNIGVSGIPVAIRMIDGPENAILTPVTQTGTDGRATSTLTVTPVNEPVTIDILALIDIEESTTASKGVIGRLREQVGNILGRSLSASGPGDRNPAQDDPHQVELSITIQPTENRVDSVYVWISPDHMLLPPDSNGVATVSAVAYDEDGLGIPNLQFSFRVRNQAGGTAGVISRPQATDSTGTARATLSTNRQYGTWDVEVRTTPDQEPPYTSTILVEETPTRSAYLELRSDTPQIYADGGITNAMITAVLKDQDQVAITNDTIRFAAIGTGSIAGYAITDTTGSAVAYFYDSSVPTEEDEPVEIRARYVKGTINIVQSVFVEILPNRNIGSVTINIPQTTFTASLSDSVEISAIARYTNNELVVANTPVVLSSDRGSFTSPILYTNSDGRVSTYFKPGTVATPFDADADRIWAVVQVEGYDPWVTPDELMTQVRINPTGPAGFRNLQASETTMYTNSRVPAQITATVIDTFGNSCRSNIGVEFNAVLGSITPTSVTNDTGKVYSQFTPGTTAGTAKIRVVLDPTTMDSTYINIVSGTPQSIDIYSASPTIAVRGTGGLETTTITAVVNDANNNPVQDETEVHFRLDVFPSGPEAENPQVNLDDGTDPESPFPGQPYDVAYTNSGIAQVSISSGTEIGLMQLVVWAFPDPEDHTDSVWANFTGLQVVAGPPAFIELDVNNDGIDGGGTIWNVEVSARVADRHNNPVADSIEVSFTVEPEIATIISARTGNPDLDNEVTAGVANTIMGYNSSVTNQRVDITAVVISETGDEVSTTFEDYVLPIQDPAGQLQTDRANYFYSGATDNASFETELYVFDGHEVCINGQLVRFLANRGQFHFSRSPNSEVVPEMVTGDIGEYVDIECGWARRYLVIPFNEAFPDPTNLEATATINAILPGYEEATIEPVTVDLRHQ